MKSILKTRVWLPMAATAILISAFVGQASTLVPFRGSVHGEEVDVVEGNPPNQIVANGSVAGVATHLGKFTMTYQLTVTLPTASATGSAQFVAANGDIIFTQIVGQAEPVPDRPGVVRIVEHETITGGTGRFVGAAGTFTMERLLYMTTPPPFFTSGSFEGQITSPGAAH